MVNDDVREPEERAVFLLVPGNSRDRVEGGNIAVIFILDDGDGESMIYNSTYSQEHMPPAAHMLLIHYSIL